ncbi:hypothetical protein [Methylorubrum sp. SL192]|uniref:hypothetical protein n=1 Tax=Methylorubrum sp. SL192 TaxID=2995167 RepID=UPI003FA3523F
MKGRIRVTGLDAVDFLSHGTKKWPKNTLVYSDPPYYVKGPDLYYNFYKHDDHVSISRAIQSNIKAQKWIVSYDDVPSIRELYSERQWISYDIGYSARTTRKGTEIMFFDDSLHIPDLAGPISLVTDHRIPRTF